MILIPLNDHETKHTALLIVIQAENLERMKQADPITLESAIRGGMLTAAIQYPENLSLLIAYEPDEETLMAEVKKGIVNLCRYLERGRTWNPDKDGLRNFLVTRF